MYHILYNVCVCVCASFSNPTSMSLPADGRPICKSNILSTSYHTSLLVLHRWCSSNSPLHCTRIPNIKQVAQHFWQSVSRFQLQLQLGTPSEHRMTDRFNCYFQCYCCHWQWVPATNQDHLASPCRVRLQVPSGSARRGWQVRERSQWFSWCWDQARWRQGRRLRRRQSNSGPRKGQITAGWARTSDVSEWDLGAGDIDVLVASHCSNQRVDVGHGPI